MSYSNYNQTFKNLLEKRFGSNFTVSVREIGQFINDLINDGIDEDFIIKSIVSLFRDGGINFNSLLELFKYMGYELPVEFGFYADKARTIIREAASKTSSEIEMLELLYFYYQNDRIDYNTYKTALSLMNRKVTPEFDKMSDVQRKTQTFIIDRDGNSKLLSAQSSNLLKCCQSIKEFDVSDLFIPSYQYDYSMDFIYDYMQQNNISHSVLTNAGLDRRKKNKLNNQEVISKIDAFRLIFILDLPTTIAKQFLTICGHTFSPLSKRDLFFLDYLNGKYKKVKTLEELTELSRNYCYENFSYKTWL